MTYFGIAQIAAFTALIAALTKPLGWVFAGERTVLRPVLGSRRRGWEHSNRI